MATTKKPRRRANREGSVYFDKRLKLWRAAVSPAPGSQGKRRYASGRTQAEAVIARDTLKREMGLDTGTGEIPRLVDYAPRWMAMKRASGRRETTLRTYQSALTVHVLPELGGQRLDEITPRRLQAWVDGLAKRGLTASQIRRSLTVLGSIYASACRQQLVASNPVHLVEQPAYTPTEARWLEESEARRFIAASRADELGPLWIFLVTTALRIGEALGLNWSDVDLQTGEVSVTKQLQRMTGRWIETPPKSDRVRTVYAPPLALTGLQQWRETQDAWRSADWPAEHEGRIFRGPRGVPIHLATARLHLSKVLASADLGHVTIHQLRHSAGSLALAAGADMRTIQQVLGHSDMRQTSRTYVHVVQTLLKDSAARMGRILEDPEKDAPDGPTAAT